MGLGGSSKGLEEENPSCLYVCESKTGGVRWPISVCGGLMCESKTGWSHVTKSVYKKFAKWGGAMGPEGFFFFLFLIFY